MNCSKENNFNIFLVITSASQIKFVNILGINFYACYLSKCSILKDFFIFKYGL